MARSEFSARFGYARWLMHLRDGEAPTHAGIGKAIGVKGQTVSGWMRREDATDSRSYNRALAAHLGVTEGWLVDGIGPPPHADLWPAWAEARQSRAGVAGEIDAPATIMNAPASAFLRAETSADQKPRRRAR